VGRDIDIEEDWDWDWRFRRRGFELCAWEMDMRRVTNSEPSIGDIAIKERSLGD